MKYIIELNDIHEVITDLNEILYDAGYESVACEELLDALYDADDPKGDKLLDELEAEDNEELNNFKADTPLNKKSFTELLDELDAMDDEELNDFEEDEPTGNHHTPDCLSRIEGCACDCEYGDEDNSQVSRFVYSGKLKGPNKNGDMFPTEIEEQNFAKMFRESARNRIKNLK